MSRVTPSQTIGPFPHECWRWAVDKSAPERAVAAVEMVAIEGKVFDRDGQPIDDAFIEVWSPAGTEAAMPLAGFVRVPSGEDGSYSFRVRRPAPSEPALYLTLFARGLLVHRFSAVFLGDDPALTQSSLLAQVPLDRRSTLLARPGAPSCYRWDIWLQSERETVFFDFE